MTDTTDSDKDKPIGDRDAVQLRFNVSKKWVEEKLMSAYPHTTSSSQAARAAVLDGVEVRVGSGGVQTSIGRDVVAAMERAGGEVENSQSVKIAGGEDDATEEE